MTREASQFPKLPLVSFYAVRDRTGRERWRLTYRVPGYPRRTDRLGLDARKAFKWAQTVSDTVESVKARSLNASDAYRRLCVDRRPISGLVDAYERHLKAKGVNPDYLASTIHRLRESLNLGDIRRMDQLTREAVDRLQPLLIEIPVAEGSEKKISRQTANYYLRSLKQFTRWLAQTGRTSDNPLQHVPGVKVGAEIGRRREATIEDVKAIYTVAMADDAKGRTMRGPDRAMLYLFAFCTGLRQDELRSVQVEWLQLEGDRPQLVIAGDFTKNENRAEQPLPAWLASAAIDWLGKRKTGPLFLRMPQDMCRPFERDLIAAKLEKKNHDGKLVFHSLRHGYASALLDSDTESKLVQSLTRHSTITLLFDRYGHANKSKAHAAVDRAIPNLIGGAE